MCLGLQADSIRAASHAVLPRLSPRPLSPKTGLGAAMRRASTSDSDSDRHSAVSHVSRMSHLSEAQRSLASITSLMSTDMRRTRPQRTRRQSQACSLFLDQSTWGGPLVSCLNMVELAGRLAPHGSGIPGRFTELKVIGSVHVHLCLYCLLCT